MFFLRDEVVLVQVRPTGQHWLSGRRLTSIESLACLGIEDRDGRDRDGRDRDGRGRRNEQGRNATGCRVPALDQVCNFAGDGAPRRSRTSGLLIRSQSLYPAELWAHPWNSLRISKD